ADKTARPINSAKPVTFSATTFHSPIPRLSDSPFQFFLLLSREKSIITGFATFWHLSYLTNRRFALTEQEIQQEVTAIVAEVTEMDKDEIWEKRDANFFKELEVDSLLALEILAMIEKKFKIQIPEERLVDITCLNATIDLTKSILVENGRL